MPTCFVIQPFDSKFNKRFDDIYSPAIHKAELEAYRVDRDPSVEVPINAIESGIRNSAICLADITQDNPNVWYELGFAISANIPVVLLCANDSQRIKYPFDIQHRTIISYNTDSLSDFNTLSESITEKLISILDKSEFLQKIAKSDPIAQTDGLSQVEILTLAIIAGAGSTSTSSISQYTLANEAGGYGLNKLGISIGVRKLIQKEFIDDFVEYDSSDGEEYTRIRVTSNGWDWICNNEEKFTTHAV
ncbi:hypothetical protein [Aquitalea aquatica]|uniref:Nucleoside 2-deoxyribosyltransferase n=1 Tax=Aquitalea aquatica TaxID=3044273 RepID=A0A838Y070_9NEIS|nr:hypothetical protein [Aquitalea magnusonii]MBA4707288.1 hypothetical protein [Aquitalea magnusonii]